MEILKLSTHHIDKILDLQSKVLNSVEDKEILMTLERDEFLKQIEDGYVYGVLNNDEVIACRSLKIPDVNEEEHLGIDAGIKDLEHIIYSEISFVDPDFRGNGLQTKLGNTLIDKVKSEGKFKYVIATVMPINIPSLKDKFKLGFVIVQTKYKYDCKRRHIMLLNLTCNSEYSGETFEKDYDDIDWMLEHGKEYIGVSLKDSKIEYLSK